MKEEYDVVYCVTSNDWILRSWHYWPAVENQKFLVINRDEFVDNDAKGIASLRYVFGGEFPTDVVWNLVNPMKYLGLSVIVHPDAIVFDDDGDHSMLAYMNVNNI